MYTEHLNYQRKLIESIRHELERFPTQWSVAQQAPTWADSIRVACRTAENEITTVHKEALNLRKLVCRIRSPSSYYQPLLIGVLTCIS
jgi:hypothetical protein